MSAVDSVMQTSMTMHIETMAATWNCGAPKWNGVGKPITEAFLTASKLVMPSGRAISVPATRPSRMDICWRKPRRNLRISRTMTRVTAAIPMFFIEP